MKKTNIKQFKQNDFNLRIYFRDIEKIRDGIAEKVSHFLLSALCFSICVVVSFVFGWKLSLAVISYIPIVVITNAIIGKVSSHAVKSILIDLPLLNE